MDDRAQVQLLGRERGEARVEITGGPTLELRPGVLASIPAGTETTWHVTPPFKEFWVIG